jgi:hypothetical protein
LHAVEIVFVHEREIFGVALDIARDEGAERDYFQVVVARVGESGDGEFFCQTAAFEFRRDAGVHEDDLSGLESIGEFGRVALIHDLEAALFWIVYDHNPKETIMRRIVTLGALISLLTGCGKTPDAAPKAPGTSAQLAYPVVLTGPRRIVVKDDELSLTTTTVASGLNFPEFAVLDSSGARFSVSKVTDIGRTSTILDMGTTPYRVFLEMKNEGKLGLEESKSRVSDSADSRGAAMRALVGVHSMAELIAACRQSWEWR